MRTIWALCVLELKQMFTKPRSYFVMFGMPLLFTLIFGGLLGEESKVSITITDRDQTTLSKSYYEELEKSDLFHVEKATYVEGKKKIEDKKAVGIIVIPKGFQQYMLEGNPKSVVFQASNEFTGGSSIEQVLESSMKQIEIAAKGSQMGSVEVGADWETIYINIHKQNEPVVITKDTVIKNEQSMSNISGRAVGFSILFVMIVMLTATGAILKAKQIGVWKRLLTTPATRMQILGGYVLSFFLIGWIQFGLLMVLTNMLFHVEWGNIFGVLILVSMLLLAVIGLALWIGSIVKTAEQQSAFGTIVIISTCMISGLYWPIEIEPEWMQQLANFVPQTWAMRGFTELMVRGGGLVDIAGYIGVLFLFAIIFFSLGLWKIRHD